MNKIEKGCGGCRGWEGLGGEGGGGGGMEGVVVVVCVKFQDKYFLIWWFSKKQNSATSFTHILTHTVTHSIPAAKWRRRKVT